ncbi:MAG: hypothetical protein FP814_06460 [Desulfobacterium sp.]|nr:hypothetical protein [Desulfobacterium sp.]MBU3947683.1 hypothetical protein [Pseudomonadota bacterium]MBU4035177.1 hypothetical protein [Pseudomonadota bacterium]
MIKIPETIKIIKFLNLILNNAARIDGSKIVKYGMQYNVHRTTCIHQDFEKDALSLNKGMPPRKKTPRPNIHIPMSVLVIMLRSIPEPGPKALIIETASADQEKGVIKAVINWARKSWGRQATGPKVLKYSESKGTFAAFRLFIRNKQ